MRHWTQTMRRRQLLLRKHRKSDQILTNTRVNTRDYKPHEIHESESQEISYQI